MLTLGNLICGASATVALLSHGNYELAFWLVVASAIFDFFDGFAARLLKSTSAIGVQLDSLADMVSFGLAPATILYTLISGGATYWHLFDNFNYALAGVPFLVTAFSALRLRQTILPSGSQVLS